MTRILLPLLFLVPLATAEAIPVFSRQYRTGCTTCHTAAPKLNVLGEAFRLNGYRFPVDSALLRPAEGVSLGSEEWKSLWPRAIWPGEVPMTAPLALRIELDAMAMRGSDTTYSTTFRLPNEIYLLAASPLGDGIAVFGEAEWSREGGFKFNQARIAFQDPLRWLPERALNVWAGLQNPYLVTFADRETDRAARVRFSWQDYRVRDLRPRDGGTGTLVSANAFQLRGTFPTLEINGLLARRFYYGIGVAQGSGSGTADQNQHKDVYYKLRYKRGGLALDGSYDAAGHAPKGWHGQLLDRALILEHFGYFGAEPVGGGRDDRHRSHGTVMRVLYERLDAGAGYVVRHDADPWAGEGTARATSVFGRAELMVFPWLVTSVKAERFAASAVMRPGSVYRAPSRDELRVAPGVVALVRQNVRLVAEGDLYARHSPSAQAGRERPATLWLRLDFAF